MLLCVPSPHLGQLIQSYFRPCHETGYPTVSQSPLRTAGNSFSLTGCGTGKYLKVNSQVHVLGCDYCGPLVEIARSRGCEVMVCDNLNLPFRDQGFDAIISIGGKAAGSHVRSSP